MIKIPPHSIEAEQAVLGGLLISPDSLEKIAGSLRPTDFYRGQHRAVYHAILALHTDGQPFDAVTLGEFFEAKGISETVGGIAYLADLANNTPSAANIRSYADIVRKKAIQRALIEIGTGMVEDAFGDCDASATADAAVRALMELERSGVDHESTIKEAMREAITELQACHEAGTHIRGVPSGLDRLDSRLGGFHDGDLIVIGARPSVGKTALLFNVAEHGSRTVPVGIISAEQPRMQVGQRIMSISSGVPAELMRSGRLEDQHWPRLTGAMADLSGRDMLIYDRSAPTLDDVCRIARKWRKHSKIKALYLDYVQRIRVPGADRITEVSAVARGLKDLARDLGIPLIALAQVKAVVDQRQDKRPGMGDLANSDELTREADIIVMLYRDEVYNQNSPDRGTAELLIEKNRHGPCGLIRAAWLAETMRFRDLASGP